MELKLVTIDFPEGANIILGQTHFIKTVEDLYEIMVGISDRVKFGIAFCMAVDQSCDMGMSELFRGKK